MLSTFVARWWDGIRARPPPPTFRVTQSEMKKARLRLGIPLGTYLQLRTCAKSDGGLKHWAYPVKVLHGNKNPPVLGHVFQLSMQLGHGVRSRFSEAVGMQKLRYSRCDRLCRKQRWHFELQTVETTIRCICCLASRKTDKTCLLYTSDAADE